MPKKKIKFNIVSTIIGFRGQRRIVGHFSSSKLAISVLGCGKSYFYNYGSQGGCGNVGEVLVKKHGIDVLINEGSVRNVTHLKMSFTYHVKDFKQENPEWVKHEYVPDPALKKDEYRGFPSPKKVVSLEDKIKTLEKVVLQQEKILNMLESREFISDAIELRNEAREKTRNAKTNEVHEYWSTYQKAFDDLFEKWGLDV